MQNKPFFILMRPQMGEKLCFHSIYKKQDIFKEEKNCINYSLDTTWGTWLIYVLGIYFINFRWYVVKIIVKINFKIINFSVTLIWFLMWFFFALWNNKNNTLAHCQYFRLSFWVLVLSKEGAFYSAHDLVL